MKIGINTCLWIWPFNRSRVDLFNKIKGYGFEAVEMTIENRSKKNTAVIKEKLKKAGLECSLCSSFLNGNLISEDRVILKKGIEYAIDSIDLCEYLGAGILVGPIYGSCINKNYLNSKVKAKASKQCAEALRCIGNYALKKNIRIAVEPINRYESNFLNTAKEGINLIAHVNLKNVGLLLDTYHMNIEEKNAVKAVLNAGDLLFHLHVPENDRGTPGTGNIDWEGLSASLKQMQYGGLIIMESGSPRAREVAALGAFWRVYDFSQDKMASEGFNFLKKTFCSE
jgi:D-psicose/D-tagatose/L-ribulose 3-epimerase